MRRKVILDKRIGETPLEAIGRWKRTHPRYTATLACYAGRLDPMASGKLLILLGKECKRQQEYTKLDKVYDIEILLDVGSDTGDVLGIVSASGVETHPAPKTIKEVLTSEVGSYERAYPVYSSKTVDGKPLFLHALEGTLAGIVIPTHTETIHRIRYRGLRSLSSARLKAHIASLLVCAPTSTEPSKALGADFRIAAVRESWEKVFVPERTYSILKLTVSCASGTYMRTLAERIGQTLGTKGLALSIRRTKIRGV
jgi:tRNA pseudouridine55 synthase